MNFKNGKRNLVITGTLIFGLAVWTQIESKVLADEQIEEGAYSEPYIQMEEVTSISEEALTPIILEQPIEEVMPVNLTTVKPDVYASDVAMKTSQVGYGKLTLDKNSQNKQISLKVNGQRTTFDKGIGAHATSTIVYDIEEVGYSSFTTYLGVDAGQGTNGSVKFKIYIDNDLVYQSGVLSGNSEAQFVKVFLNGGKELKLVADANGRNACDHAVYADAKFVDEAPVFTVDTIADLDAQINQLLNAGELTANQTAELNRLVMNRELTSKVGGYRALMNLVNDGTIGNEFVEWFMSNVDAQKYYLNSGNPKGTHAAALKILENIWTKDMSSRTGFNLKIATAMALEHSKQLNFWLDSKQKIDPVHRYELYRDLQDEMLPVFKTLDVANLRQVINARITDADILWVRNHIQTNHPHLIAQGKIGNAGHLLGYNTRNPYGVSIHANNFYGTDPTFARVFEYGGVCGSISYTGAMTAKAFGVPANPVGQPGHCAFYTLTPSGWKLNNTIADWTKTNSNVLGPWAKFSSGFNSSYTLLAAEASNQVEAFEASDLLRLKSHSVQGTDKLAYLNQAIEMLPINYEAWVEKIILLQDNPATTITEYQEMKNEILSIFKEYPMPMTDLLNRFKSELLEGGVAARADYILSYKQTLESITTNPAKQFAKKYLAQMEADNMFIVKFSFNGENANQLYGITSEMEYSLDGGVTYITPDEVNYKLNDMEIAGLTPENGIIIRIKNTDITETLPITKAATTKLTFNDEEKLIFGLNETMEYSLDSGLTWIKFNAGDSNKLLEGAGTVMVRKFAAGTVLAGDIQTITFTDAQAPANMVGHNKMQVIDFSSQKNAKDQAAANAVDGNTASIWHGDWKADKDTARYLTVRLDEATYVNKIGYLPRQDGSPNGRILEYTIYTSMDGVEFTPVNSGEWGNTKGMKYAEFEAVEAQYIKIVGNRTVGGWISMSELNVYFDNVLAVEKAKEENVKAQITKIKDALTLAVEQTGNIEGIDQVIINRPAVEGYQSNVVDEEIVRQTLEILGDQVQGEFLIMLYNNRGFTYTTAEELLQNNLLITYVAANDSTKYRYLGGIITKY